ncbi:MAG TPA: hypothetical protein VIW78_08620, partial [Burkholderiales bacterium]
PPRAGEKAMRKSIAAAAIVSLLCLPGVAPADTSLGIRAGTLGAGAEISYAVSQRLALRLGADTYTRTGTVTKLDIEYDAKAKLQTASLLADWFPFANNFRLSLGVMYNGNKVTGTGKPTAGTFTINGVPYQASDVGTLDATVDFKKTAPYFGIGYGRPINGGLSFLFDLGVMFQGKPIATLTASCGPTAPQGSAQCNQIGSDVAAEQATADEKLKNFKYYPVLSLGLAYTF